MLLGYHPAMQKKHISRVIWLIVTLVFRSVADDDLYIKECQNSSSGKEFNLCLSRSAERPQQISHLHCLENHFLNVMGFILYIPKEDMKPENCMVEIHEANFFYNGTIHSSCLIKHSPSEVKRLMLAVMEDYSGLPNAESKNSSVLHYMRSNNLLGLPDFTQVEISHDCLQKDGSKIPYMDICENMNLSEEGITKVHVGFNSSMYNSSQSSPACSCMITSASNDSKDITARAFDIRLTGSTRVSLFGTTKRDIESSEFYWWEDGVLLQTSNEIVVELSNLDPSDLPPSVRLLIEGQELSIKCSNQSSDNTYTHPQDRAQNLWYIIIVAVVIGILTLLLFAVLWKCCCKSFRTQIDKDEYAMVEPNDVFKNNNSSCGNESYHGDEITKERLDGSSDYFEVEPQSGEAPANGNHHDNIYSHLRDGGRVFTPGNLYDCVSNDYSTLQGRKEPPTITNNIYNT